MKITIKEIIILCAFVLLPSGTFAQSAAPGDDWKLVAYNFARVNNYDINGKDITVTLDTREQRIAGNSGCNRFIGPFRFEDSGRLAIGPFAGFDFKKGRYYVIEVERTKNANPAADGSAYSHKLIRIVKEAKKEKDL